MLPAFFLTNAQAATLLNPKPENSTTLFGRSVAVVGDLNADGVPDLAVGTPYEDSDFLGAEGFGPPQNVGKVFLIDGADLSVLAICNDPEFQHDNLLKFAGQLGTSVAALGDINGDGVPDVIGGNPHHTVESDEEAPEEERLISAGQAFVFSGADGSVLLTLNDPTPEENARAGYSVAGLGDVNRDGIPDLVIGVPGKDTAAGSDVGVAYIYSGADGSLIRTLNHPDQGGAEADARFGFAVANAGHVNPDGVNDILIGAPGRSVAFVFNGKTGKLIHTISSPVAEKLPSFGYAVAGGKDLDGDNVPDFVVGSPLFNRSQGAAYEFKGTDASLIRKLQFPAKAVFSRFGASVFLTDDVTGDDRADIMVGAPDEDVNGLINAGDVRIFNGATGTLFKVLTSTEPQAFAGFGYAFTTADFNNDGAATAVVGVPFQNADLIDPEDGDLVTHLQIGKIETQEIQ